MGGGGRRLTVGRIERPAVRRLGTEGPASETQWKWTSLRAWDLRWGGTRASGTGSRNCLARPWSMSIGAMSMSSVTLFKITKYGEQVTCGRGLWVGSVRQTQP